MRAKQVIPLHFLILFSCDGERGEGREGRMRSGELMSGSG